MRPSPASALEGRTAWIGVTFGPRRPRSGSG
jgi:hypothetical protein